MFACFCWKRMPHRRRANEVSLCYLQSGGTCTGRSKLDSLHRQEDSLEPAPAGWTINQTKFEFQKPSFVFVSEWKRKFDRYFDYATGNFWPIFPKDIFTDQISRSQIDGTHWIEVWFFVWDQVTSKSVWFDCLPWRKLWIRFFISLSSQASTCVIIVTFLHRVQSWLLQRLMVLQISQRWAILVMLPILVMLQIPVMLPLLVTKWMMSMKRNLN